MDGNKLERLDGKFVFNLSANNKHEIVFKNTNYGSGADSFVIDVVEIKSGGVEYTADGKSTYLCKFVPEKSGVFTFLLQMHLSVIFLQENTAHWKAIVLLVQSRHQAQ